MSFLYYIATDSTYVNMFDYLLLYTVKVKLPHYINAWKLDTKLGICDVF